MIKHIFTGFWPEIFAQQATDPDADASCLEDEFAGTALSAASFLHGFCNVFACELAKTFGYRIEEVRDFENALIHTYCVDNARGYPVYIDIRGATTDVSAFFETFAEDEPSLSNGPDSHAIEEGWISVARYQDADSYLETHANLDPGGVLSLAADAKAFIAENPEYYRWEIA